MSNIAKLLIWLSPRKIYVPAQIKLKKTWMGSEYGGFFVYLPLLNADSNVFSFGVGEDISFDQALIECKNLTVHTFDPTPRVSDFIQPHLLKYEKLTFSNIGLGAKDGEVLFFPPENAGHVSCSVVPNKETEDKAFKVQMKRLSTILEETGISDVDLLKIDIEGAEYEVVPDLLDSGILVKQLQLEIHPDLFHDGRKKTKALINQLNTAGFSIFGVSNTCRELSFINRNFL